ncbi:hypothetical protein L1987_23034 [Smallanthus sonchifolius]|uniref:Uncharacterized protein n=1 Tax=Smallanthus sonchifolius TaxID=185202 RepID=A0ACB9IGC3_9ASTR|nr:hypothetical protein L1987_23034 [Smallanthus sonchifolius]
MSSDPSCIVYIGNHSTAAVPFIAIPIFIWNSDFIFFRSNLDERVSDRVLYDILIQAGRVVDLHIPRDKETDKPKGFAFAEYETEEIADYAISGLDKRRPLQICKQHLILLLNQGTMKMLLQILCHDWNKRKLEVSSALITMYSKNDDKHVCKDDAPEI